MRQELLDNLGYTYALIKENLDCKSKLDNFNRSPMHSCMTLLFSVIITFLVMFNSSFILSKLIVVVPLPKNIVSNLSSYAILVGMVLFAVLIIGFEMLNSGMKKINKHKNAKQIEELSEKQQLSYQLLEQKSMVPKAYWDLNSVGKLYEYIENLRADSLKEALNLYEMERHQQMVAIELRKIKAYSASGAIAAWGNLLKK